MASSSGEVRDRIADAWWRGYARFYDWMWSGTLTDLVAAAIRDAAPPGRCRIVDAGTGTGLIAGQLAALGPVIGIDRSREMLARAARRPGTWLLADIRTPPLRPSSIDLVVAANVAHLCPEPGRVIAALIALVRPGGCAIFTWPPDEVGVWRLARAEAACETGLVTVGARLAVRILLAVASLATPTTRRTPSRCLLSMLRTHARDQHLHVIHRVAIQGLQHLVVLTRPVERLVRQRVSGRPPGTGS